jgi:hypothetical protein
MILTEDIPIFIERNKDIIIKFKFIKNIINIVLNNIELINNNLSSYIGIIEDKNIFNEENLNLLKDKIKTIITEKKLLRNIKLYLSVITFKFDFFNTNKALFEEERFNELIKSLIEMNENNSNNIIEDKVLERFIDNILFIINNNKLKKYIPEYILRDDRLKDDKLKRIISAIFDPKNYGDNNNSYIDNVIVKLYQIRVFQLLFLLRKHTNVPENKIYHNHTHYYNIDNHYNTDLKQYFKYDYKSHNNSELYNILRLIKYLKIVLDSDISKFISSMSDNLHFRNLYITKIQKLSTDEIESLYNRKLSEDEIESLYNRKLSEDEIKSFQKLYNTIKSDKIYKNPKIMGEIYKILNKQKQILNAIKEFNEKHIPEAINNLKLEIKEIILDKNNIESFITVLSDLTEIKKYDLIDIIKQISIDIKFESDELLFLKQNGLNINNDYKLTFYQLINVFNPLLRKIPLSTTNNNFKQLNLISKLIISYNLYNPIINDYEIKFSEYINKEKNKKYIGSEPDNIIQYAIIRNAIKIFDDLQNDECKIKLVKYFLSEKMPYNIYSQEIIKRNVSEINKSIENNKISNKSNNNKIRDLQNEKLLIMFPKTPINTSKSYEIKNKKMGEMLSKKTYKKLLGNNISNSILTDKIINTITKDSSFEYTNRFKLIQDIYKYKIYKEFIKLIREKDCDIKIELLDKIKNDVPFLFDLIYLACINSYFKDLEVLQKLTPSNENRNNITKKKEKKSIVDDIFVLSRTISQLLINEENSNKLNKDTINHILQNMKYNINGLKMKLKQTNNNNNTVYEQTMRKMIELIYNLIDDGENKNHLERSLNSLIFNGNSLQTNPSNIVTQPNPSNIVTQPNPSNIVTQPNPSNIVTQTNPVTQPTRVQNQTKKKSLFQRFKGLFRRTKKK